MSERPLFELYALSDPASGELRYVGKARDAERRLKAHLRDARRRDTPVYRWIRALGARGLRPDMVVVMIAWDWRAAEKLLIAQAREEIGWRLLNVADGGDEPFCAPSVRQANARKVNAARAADPLKRRVWELKRAIGYGLKSGIVSEETKRKLRLAAARNPRLFGEWAAL